MEVWLHSFFFYVNGSVHRESIIVQQNATIYSFILFLQTALHVSGYNFTHHQEHTQTVFTTSGTGRTIFATFRCRGGVGTGFLFGSSSDSSTRAEGGKYGLTSARCCNYSLCVLLMIGDGITRNIWSSLHKHKNCQ